LHDLIRAQYEAALAAATDTSASAEERAEMLMEIAMGLQARPKSPRQMQDAIGLYQRALEVAPAAASLLRARITARMGTALHALPDEDGTYLPRALESLTTALATLESQGKPEEAAETLLNLGLVQQSLVASGRARIQEAIGSYHKALRVFTREKHPREFALLHNNLAIAYLSIPASDERARMREALAVQSFEEVLKVINLIDHPTEYAMIQNNLGNALQYVSSGHLLENNLRALAAYDEALRVRNERDTPVEYANTIANKANVLRGLPAGLEPESGSTAPADPLRAASGLYREAERLYRRHGEVGRAGIVADCAREIDAELALRRAGVN
jgi:tetratricopeptide (TPR) repeat protein